jgi:hypothetical protein
LGILLCEGCVYPYHWLCFSGSVWVMPTVMCSVGCCLAGMHCARMYVVAAARTTFLSVLALQILCEGLKSIVSCSDKLAFNVLPGSQMLQHCCNITYSVQTSLRLPDRHQLFVVICHFICSIVLQTACLHIVLLLPLLEDLHQQNAACCVLHASKVVGGAVALHYITYITYITCSTQPGVVNPIQEPARGSLGCMA